MREEIKGIIFDIDGTILRGSTLMPLVSETLRQLRASQIKICFLTNDNRVSISQWLKRFRTLGIEAYENEIVTSATIAAEAVAQFSPQGAVLIAGDAGLREALQAQNLRLIEWESGIEADIIVMGKDPDFDQHRLNLTCQQIWNGAKFFATNNDRKMPVADGYIPATGAMVQAVAYATSTEPIVTGKPSMYAAESILKRMNLMPDQAVIVGDSLTSDIKLGKNAKMRTVLTLTGTHGRFEASALPNDEQPDHIIEDLGELIPTLFGEPNHD